MCRGLNAEEMCKHFPSCRPPKKITPPTSVLAPGHGSPGKNMLRLGCQLNKFPRGWLYSCWILLNINRTIHITIDNLICNIIVFIHNYIMSFTPNNRAEGYCSNSNEYFGTTMMKI